MPRHGLTRIGLSKSNAIRSCHGFLAVLDDGMRWLKLIGQVHQMHTRYIAAHHQFLGGCAVIKSGD